MWWVPVAQNLQRFLGKYTGEIAPLFLGITGFVFELFFKKSPDASVLGVCAALIGSPLFTNKDRTKAKTTEPHRDQRRQWEDEALRQEEMELQLLQQKEQELQASIAKRRQRKKGTRDKETS